LSQSGETKAQLHIGDAHKGGANKLFELTSLQREALNFTEISASSNGFDDVTDKSSISASMKLSDFRLKPSFA
jgi:hypothetical protein